MPKREKKTRAEVHLLKPVGYDPLGERLRREAIESWPDFSESLHERILQSVEDRRDEVVKANLRRTQSRRRARQLTALLTAACLLCAVAVGWRFHTLRLAAARNAVIEQHLNEFIAQVASPWSAGDWLAEGDVADQAAAGVEVLLDSAGLSPRSPALADDALQAADALLRRLPIDTQLAASE